MRVWTRLRSTVSRCFAVPSRSVVPMPQMLLLIVAWSLLIAPQAMVGTPQNQDDDVVRVDTNLVVLNVTVMNERGEYVHGLKRTDFRVLEDNREQAISTFSVEETPFAAALLLDTSGSMENRISLARSAAIRFLDGLRPDDTAAVYRFDTAIEQLQEFSSSRDLAPLAFDIRAKGWTMLNDAIARAADDLTKRPEKRRAIVVLSDGADTRSRLSAETSLNAALAANAAIYTVDMSAPEVRPQDRQASAAALRNFAGKSGGRFVATAGGQALRDAFSGIVEELSNQYTIGYRPINRARDGRWRSIEIKLARPDLSVRTRKSYRAPKN